MIKAKLTDGTIIELVKDCECIHHSGPHWLHLDDLDKRRAKEFLDRGCVEACITLELERLDRKLFELESRGIEKIIREG